MIEITRRFEDAWLKWDGVPTPEAWARVQQVMEHDLFTADRGDGSERLRPSMLNDPCARRKMLSFHGYRSNEAEEDLTMLRMGSQGTWLHYRHQLMGLSTGLLTDIEVPVHHKRMLLSGSVDGVTYDGVGAEVKTLHGNWFNRLFPVHRESEWEPPAKNMLQVHAYMHALGTSEHILLYENRSDGQMVEFTVFFDETTNSELLLKVDPLLVHVENGTLPPLLPLCRQMTGQIYEKCTWKEACFREL